MSNRGLEKEGDDGCGAGTAGKFKQVDTRGSGELTGPLVEEESCSFKIAIGNGIINVISDLCLYH